MILAVIMTALLMNNSQATPELLRVHLGEARKSIILAERSFHEGQVLNASQILSSLFVQATHTAYSYIGSSSASTSENGKKSVASSAQPESSSMPCHASYEPTCEMYPYLRFWNRKFVAADCYTSPLRIPYFAPEVAMEDRKFLLFEPDRGYEIAHDPM